MDAFFLIDKPSGITSFGVLKEMRKALGIKKIGHTGTLDPLATGCLLVATGRYTKLIPYFEKDTKQYECTIMLDGSSDSFDIDTEVTYISKIEQEKYIKELTQEYIASILKEKFIGEIEQVPPSYSALKIGGKKAVDLVRAGKTPEMKSRKVTISKIEILDFLYPQLRLKIDVSAGTYIRSIAKDLGEVLGTGGYISELRRIMIGNISIDTSLTLADIGPEKHIQEQDLFPSDMFYELDDTDVLWRLSNGQRIAGGFNFPKDREIFLFGENKIQYIVKYSGGVLTPIKKIL